MTLHEQDKWHLKKERQCNTRLRSNVLKWKPQSWDGFSRVTTRQQCVLNLYCSKGCSSKLCFYKGVGFFFFFLLYFSIVEDEGLFCISGSVSLFACLVEKNNESIILWRTAFNFCFWVLKFSSNRTVQFFFSVFNYFKWSKKNSGHGFR